MTEGAEGVREALYFLGAEQLLVMVGCPVVPRGPCVSLRLRVREAGRPGLVAVVGPLGPGVEHVGRLLPVVQ